MTAPKDRAELVALANEAILEQLRTEGRVPNHAATIFAALEAAGVALVPAVATDAFRLTVHLAQYRHINATGGWGRDDATLLALAQEKVNDPKQRALDHASWAVGTATYAPEARDDG